jgi:ABC-2 type transport system ATP-binding protein
MIEVNRLRKHFGPVAAVDGLSLAVQPGRVTGFLGPNGAAKSTTIRLILGLDHPDTGTATIDGKRYRELVEPLRVVGARLEATAVHTGRSAYNDLLVLAQTQGLPRRRVDEVIDLVGLRDVASKRVGGFSLGMGQRLGLAAALLGDPGVLLDEPVNGLDPEGIVWVENLMKYLAGQGRTVFVSSHLMNEMAVTADHLVVIGRGRLIADCATDQFVARSSQQSVLCGLRTRPRLSELITAELVAFPSFFLGAAILHSKAPVALGDPGVLRAVIGSGLYLVVLGLFALAIGALLRRTAAGITGVIGFVLVLAQLAQLLPGSVGEHVHAYLPSEAGRLIAQAHQGPHDLLTPWQGFGVFCLWTAVLLGAAAYLLQRRDA